MCACTQLIGDFITPFCHVQILSNLFSHWKLETKLRSERLLHFLSQQTAVAVQVLFLHFYLNNQAPGSPQTFSLRFSALCHLS